MAQACWRRRSWSFLSSPKGDLNGHWTLIDVPGACQTFAIGINNRGQIVGFYDNCVAGTSDIPFLRQPDGTFIDVPHLERGGSPLSITIQDFNLVWPTSITAAGEILGVAYHLSQDSPVGPLCRGFYRARNGDLQLLGRLTIAGAEVPTCTLGINSSGEISGTYYDITDVPHGSSLTRKRCSSSCVT